MEVLKQVIRLMKRIEGAFCPWSYLDQMDYFQQGGCNEEEAYAYADRKSTRLNSSHSQQSRMPSSA